MRLGRLSTALLALAMAGSCVQEEKNDLSGEAFQAQSAAPVLALTNARVITGAFEQNGKPSKPMGDGVVLVQGDRIIAVGPRQRDRSRGGEVKVPAGATEIDLGGATLLPGFINSHVHLRQGVDRFLTESLAEGVTTVCSTGGTVAEIAVAHPSGTVPDHARAFSAGSPVSAPGGYPGAVRGPEVMLPAANAEQAQKAVRQLEDSDADYVKVMLDEFNWDFEAPGDTLPLISSEALDATVKAAHERGLIVRAHVRYATQLDAALRAGVDSIEHVTFPFARGSGFKQLLQQDRLELSALPDFRKRIQRMVEADVILVPTMNNEIDAIGFLEGYDEPRKEAIGQLAFQIVGAFHRAGGRVALGNDANGHSPVELGMPFKEIEYLLRSGLTPAEVIVAATRNAAEACDQERELGTIERGKLADLIAVNGDPLTDPIGSFRQLRLIVKGGLIVESARMSPGVIPLPDGFRPEHMTRGLGASFYVGSLRDGAIYRGDFVTGEGRVLVPGKEGRSAGGVEVDGRNRLFVAGGFTGRAAVYDAATGALLAAYQLAPAGGAALVNGVAVTREAAYFTDSKRPFLYVVPLGPAGELPDQASVRALPLTGDLVYEDSSGLCPQAPPINANGIEATPDGRRLILVQTNTGLLFSVDAATGIARTIDVGGSSLECGDGLLRHGHTLYAVQGALQQISVVDLSSSYTSGSLTRVITDPVLDGPTTVVMVDPFLYALNGRFHIPPTPQTPYEVVQLPAY